MKKIKFISVIVCAILLVNCVALFTSCSGSKPELDLKTAQENLEFNDYTVIVNHYGSSRDDMDAVMFESELFAYNEYYDYISIYVFNDASMAKAYYNYEKGSYAEEKDIIDAEIKYLEYFLKIYSDDIDKDLFEEIEEELEKWEDALKEAKDLVIGISGKYVWVGTKKAIENSRK